MRVTPFVTTQVTVSIVSTEWPWLWGAGRSVPIICAHSAFPSAGPHKIPAGKEASPWAPLAGGAALFLAAGSAYHARETPRNESWKSEVQQSKENLRGV